MDFKAVLGNLDRWSLSLKRRVFRANASAWSPSDWLAPGNHVRVQPSPHYEILAYPKITAARDHQS